MSDARVPRTDVPLDPGTLPLGHPRPPTAPHPAPAAAQTLAFTSPDFTATAATVPSPDLVSTAMQGLNPDLVSTAMQVPHGKVAPAAETPLAPASNGLPAEAATTARTTVLPRLDSVGSGVPRLVADLRPRYEPLKVLGRGGMGEVSLEVDRDIGRSVAIKRLLPQTGGDVGVARFVDEVRVMGRLEHPNIVPVHDVGVDEQGRYYFVMKHVEGDTLEQIIARLRAGDAETTRRFSFEARIDVLLGILRALRFAHERGIVHRDVKPANVMVGRYGEVMLMDWGIAKPTGPQALGAQPHGLPPISGAADLVWAGAESPPDAVDPLRLSATHMGQLIGTPAYMSPEQARGENDRIDQRSDLFSAAVVFREFLTLQHHLAGATSLDELLKRAVVAQPLVAFLTTSGVPAELGHFLDKAMAIDPAGRFQTAAGMIDDLQGILEGRVHVQCPATFTKRMTREAGRVVDRHPFVGVGGLAAGAGLVLFSIVELVRLALG
jgi:serine/threonine protein kinase